MDASAQKITLIDELNLQSVPKVIFQNLDKSKFEQTDEKGSVDLSKFENEEIITTRHQSFETLKFKKSALKDTVLILRSRVVQLGEFVSSANRTEENSSEIPVKIDLISMKEIERRNPQTSADLLESSGKVFVQRSQMGGGSPVLRGFEASRVLMVVDGVRMNNAIYRSGHLQDAITIDPSMLDHTEVIFGPASAMYGSDALGGVVHFYTKKPKFSENKILIKTNAYSRYSTANREKSGHLDVNIGLKKFAFLSSFTFSDYDDLRAGEIRDSKYDTTWLRKHYVVQYNGIDSMMENQNRNIQKFSGYSQYDVLQRFALKQSDKIIHALKFNYSNSSNIPRYDRLSEYSGRDLKYAEWSYGPQERGLVSFNTIVKKRTFLFDGWSSTLAAQRISQERISRKFKNPIRRTQTENVKVYSFNLDLNKEINSKNNLHYGLEGTHNDVSSKAKSEDIVTGDSNASETRYPDGGSTMSSAAIYLSHKFILSQKFVLSEGIRYGISSLSAHFRDTTFFQFPFQTVKQESEAVTGNIGLVISPGAGFLIQVLGSSGFRTPNVDDLAKVFETGASTLIVPNPNLKPEYAYNLELGIEKNILGNFQIEARGWYTLLQNAIVVKEFNLNGDTSVVYQGSISRVMASQNANEAFITGITGGLSSNLTKKIKLKSTLTYTYGRYHDQANDTIVPMDHIPPMFGQTSLIYSQNKFEGEFYVRYNAWKELKNYSPSREDNLKYATAWGMPSWTTLNARISYSPFKFGSLQIGLENILDVHYRQFASGISSPGRNLSITLRAHF